jgi:hypothetical protein
VKAKLNTAPGAGGYAERIAEQEVEAAKRRSVRRQQTSAHFSLSGANNETRSNRGSQDGAAPLEGGPNNGDCKSDFANILHGSLVRVHVMPAVINTALPF